MTVIPPIVGELQPITGAESLHEDADRAASATGATVAVDAKQGSPPEELFAPSGDGDLVVIGSRRRGAGARVLLGRTGEKPTHNACCSLMVVPRPPSTSPPRFTAQPGEEPDDL